MPAGNVPEKSHDSMNATTKISFGDDNREYIEVNGEVIYLDTIIEE